MGTVAKKGKNSDTYKVSYKKNPFTRKLMYEWFSVENIADFPRGVNQYCSRKASVKNKDAIY